MMSKGAQLFSVANPDPDGRLHAPAAARNAAALKSMLLKHAPAQGSALELASGTGQHVAQFAHALPGLTWQPSEVDEGRLKSIAIWVAETGLTNVRAPVLLDATVPGWNTDFNDQDLILLVNLLHLIPQEDAQALISEAARALSAEGRFMLYGPFLRDGELASDGDRQFHTALQAQDRRIGYKNDEDILAWCETAGLSLCALEEMPANNLLFVMKKFA